jgi:hypothetical protein
MAYSLKLFLLIILFKYLLILCSSFFDKYNKFNLLAFISPLSVFIIKIKVLLNVKKRFKNEKFSSISLAIYNFRIRNTDNCSINLNINQMLINFYYIIIKLRNYQIN